MFLELSLQNYMFWGFIAPHEIYTKDITFDQGHFGSALFQFVFINPSGIIS